MLARASESGKLRRATRLLAWYDRHARALPWRARRGEIPDPYAVWLSEIMLQQTNVTTVKPYFEKFLLRWPCVQALAAAPIEDVMQAWAGLGYYSRARNLHACALRVTQEYGGVFPSNEDKLLKLPGVGPYTAAAIAAIAFGKRAAVVDGNVERVVTRLFRIGEALPKARALVRAQVENMSPARRPGDFAQAMMDLGAGVCTPKNPSCTLCPLANHCAAFGAGDMERFPVKAAKRERPRRLGVVFYLRRADGALAVRTRPPRGLLGGMTEFPGAPWSVNFDFSHALDLAPCTADWRQRDGEVGHVFTHFELRLKVYAAAAPANARPPENCRWVHEDALDDEALPSLMRKVAVHARAPGQGKR